MKKIFKLLIKLIALVIIIFIEECLIYSIFFIGLHSDELIPPIFITYALILSAVNTYASRKIFKKGSAALLIFTSLTVTILLFALSAKYDGTLFEPPKLIPFWIVCIFSIINDICTFVISIGTLLYLHFRRSPAKRQESAK